MLNNQNANNSFLNSKPTVDEWFNSGYCSFKGREVGSITERARKSIYSPFIKEPIGNMHLQDVRPEHLAAILGKAKNQGLASGTVFSIYALETLIFRSAYREEVIDYYPCEGLYYLTKN